MNLQSAGADISSIGFIRNSLQIIFHLLDTKFLASSHTRSRGESTCYLRIMYDNGGAGRTSMTIPILEGLIMETGEGKWRISCIGEPKQAVDSHRIDYHLRFKWLDPTNEKNQATPERWLRLATFKE